MRGMAGVESAETAARDLSGRASAVQETGCKPRNNGALGGILREEGRIFGTVPDLFEYPKQAAAVLMRQAGGKEPQS